MIPPPLVLVGAGVGVLPLPPSEPLPLPGLVEPPEWVADPPDCEPPVVVELLLLDDVEVVPPAFGTPPSERTCWDRTATW